MQNIHIVMRRETGLYNIIENGKIKGVGLSGDLLGRAPEMYSALRNIVDVAVGLNKDGVEMPLSLYVEVKRTEPLLAEIDKRCSEAERGGT